MGEAVKGPATKCSLGVGRRLVDHAPGVRAGCARSGTPDGMPLGPRRRRPQGGVTTPRGPPDASPTGSAASGLRVAGRGRLAEARIGRPRRKAAEPTFHVVPLLGSSTPWRRNRTPGRANELNGPGQVSAKSERFRMADNVIREGTKTKRRSHLKSLAEGNFLSRSRAVEQARGETRKSDTAHAVVPVLRSTAWASNAGVDH